MPLHSDVQISLWSGVRFPVSTCQLFLYIPCTQYSTGFVIYEVKAKFLTIQQCNGPLLAIQ